MSTLAPKLPKIGREGQEVLDAHRVVWQYDQQTDTWIREGSELIIPVVSETTDGLITPPTFSKLQYLKTIEQLSKLKIESDAYWYYFYSPDHFIQFKPEGQDVLRLEISQKQLWTYLGLYGMQCKGPKGIMGPCGTIGRNGVKPQKESFYTPSVVQGSRLDFLIQVPLPLETEVSLRLFEIAADVVKTTAVEIPNTPIKPSSKVDILEFCPDECRIRNLDLPDVEIWIPTGDLTNPPLPEVITDLVGINKEKTIASLILDQDRELLYGSIFLKDGAWDGKHTFLKARQRGPGGDQGRDVGNVLCKVDCSNNLVELPALCPIATVRFDCKKQKFYISRVCLEDPCTTRLTFNQSIGFDSLSALDATIATFTAVETTLSACKKILKFDPELEVGERPDLGLDDWTPNKELPNCRHHCKSQFQWVPETNSGSWERADGSLSRLYPFNFVTTETPVSQACCSDDSFYCVSSAGGGTNPDPYLPPQIGTPFEQGPASINPCIASCDKTIEAPPLPPICNIPEPTGGTTEPPTGCANFGILGIHGPLPGAGPLAIYEGSFNKQIAYWEAPILGFPIIEAKWITGNAFDKTPPGDCGHSGSPNNVNICASNILKKCDFGTSFQYLGTTSGGTARVRLGYIGPNNTLIPFTPEPGYTDLKVHAGISRLSDGLGKYRIETGGFTPGNPAYVTVAVPGNSRLDWVTVTWCQPPGKSGHQQRLTSCQNQYPLSS